MKHDGCFRMVPALLVLQLLAFTPFGFSAEKGGASLKPGDTLTVPDSRNQIIKFTDSGLQPSELHMKREDSIVFFLNDTKETLTTLEVDFKDKHTHCASGNLNIIEGGKIASVRPFGPTDFSTTCFHDPGSYTYTVYGLKANPKGVVGHIIVE